MPRSIQQILDQAEALASRFEDYEPRIDDQRPADALVAIRAAVIERARTERRVVEAVTMARKDGCSWASIGASLGTSGEAARQKYAQLVSH